MCSRINKHNLGVSGLRSHDLLVTFCVFAEISRCDDFGFNFMTDKNDPTTGMAFLTKLFKVSMIKHMIM